MSIGVLYAAMCVWGARHPDQLPPVDEVIGWSLDASAKAGVDRILRETITDPVGPESCYELVAICAATSNFVCVRDLTLCVRSTSWA
jgi:hypothetical protein